MNQEFREKLMAAEPDNPAGRAEYEKRLNALLEEPITWKRKGGLLLAIAASLASIVISTVLAVRFRHGPAVVLEAMAIGAGFGIVGLIVAGRILLRGVYHRRRDTVTQANLIWVFTVLLQVTFMEADGLHPQSGMRLTIFGLVFLIGASVLLLRTVIEQSELRTREKLLELQCDVAELKDVSPKLNS